MSAGYQPEYSGTWGNLGTNDDEGETLARVYPFPGGEAGPGEAAAEVVADTRKEDIIKEHLALGTLYLCSVGEPNIFRGNN